jgi:hypothetical protein
MNAKKQRLKIIAIIVLVAIIVPAGGSNIEIANQEGVQEGIPPEKGVVLDNKDWHKINDTRIFNTYRENPKEIKDWKDESVHPYENQSWEYNIEPYEQISRISGMNRSRVNEIQKRFDFIYDTTFPKIEYPEHNQTAEELPYRGNEYDLHEIYYYEFQNFTAQYLGNLSVSNRTEDSPPPQSGEYIKDAHSTIVGVPGSGTVKTTAEKFDGERIVPENGRVFVYMDYRIEVNESTQCERVTEDRRICRQEKFENTSIKKHTVKFSTTKNSTLTFLGDTQSGVATYCCIKGHREVSFTTLAKPKVVVNVSESEYERQTTEEGEYQWVQVSQSYREETEILAVQDHMTAYRLGNTTVRQQVFEGGGQFTSISTYPTNQIDVSFRRSSTGEPESRSSDITPYMWQELEFTNGGTIKNIWQIYSAADNQSALMYYSKEKGSSKNSGQTGDSSSSGGPVRKIKEIDGPVFPELYIAPTRAKPLLNDLDAQIYPQESRISRVPTYQLSKHENNSLTWANTSEGYESFYLLGSLGEIKSVTNIAGNEVPVNTSYWDIDMPELDILYGRDYDNVYTSRDFGSSERGIDPVEAGASDGRVMLAFWRWAPDDYEDNPWEKGYHPLKYETLDLEGTVRNTATTNEKGVIFIRPVEDKVKISYKGGWKVIGHKGDIGAGREADDYYDHLDKKIGDAVWFFDVKSEKRGPTEKINTLVSAFVNRLRLLFAFLAVLGPMYWTARAYRR